MRKLSRGDHDAHLLSDPVPAGASDTRGNGSSATSMAFTFLAKAFTQKLSRSLSTHYPEAPADKIPLPCNGENTLQRADFFQTPLHEAICLSLLKHFQECRFPLWAVKAGYCRKQLQCPCPRQTADLESGCFSGRSTFHHCR